MQLMVIKTDGSEEEYLHTKVIATFVNAFAEPAENNTYMAQQLAESVTFYLYSKHNSNKITSCEILSIIKAVLSSTGFYNAALTLAEHCQRRNLLRTRVEVIKIDSDDRTFNRSGSVRPWNKSKIISDLITEHNLDTATARTVAALVEEKILNSGFRLVPTDFIKFLATSQAKAILSAQQQIKTIGIDSNIIYNAARDDRLRQPQNGLCPLEA